MYYSPAALGQFANRPLALYVAAPMAYSSLNNETKRASPMPTPRIETAYERANRLFMEAPRALALDIADEGGTEDQMLHACLQYMTADQVRNMLRAGEYV